jgi:hypothetical protein
MRVVKCNHQKGVGDARVGGCGGVGVEVLRGLLRPQADKHTYMKVRASMLVVARPAPRGGETRGAYMYSCIVIVVVVVVVVFFFLQFFGCCRDGYCSSSVAAAMFFAVLRLLPRCYCSSSVAAALLLQFFGCCRDVFRSSWVAAAM